MKLTENSLCNVIQSDNFIKHHLKYINLNIDIFNGSMTSVPPYADETYRRYFHMISEMKSNINPEQIAGFLNTFELKKTVYTSKNYRTLVFSDNALKALDNFVIGKNIRLDLLRDLPQRNDIILVDENRCIQYIKNDTTLMVLIHNRANVNAQVYSFFFGINLLTGYQIMDAEDITNKALSYDTFLEEYYSLFIKVVVHLELRDISKITLDTVRPHSKYGTKKVGIFNDLNRNIVYVNSNWLEHKILIGKEFKVRLHLRRQPYGQGRTQHKYILIDEYKKSGIQERKSGKELND